jgi:carbonic anhydrase
MLALSFLPNRCLGATLFALSLGLAAGAARAGQAEVTPSTEGAAQAEASESDHPRTPGATLPGARGPQDPMEMLRARLAQKLGAAKSVDANNPSVLRVVSKASAPPIGGQAASAPLPAVRHKLATAAAEAAPGKGAIAPPRTVIRSPNRASQWDYSGVDGPESWGRLSSDFAKCSSGVRQSPIDIRDGFKVELDAVKFDYKPSAFRVIDNGHTVQVNVEPGNSIEVMGRRYELVQFHFHRPSEERIDGKQFDMDVHLVHRDIEGRLAVVAVLLERGSAQPLVQSVWNNLPLEKGEELAAPGPMNPVDLLPTERSYVTYMGSLTTPPCSEGVLWMVMKKPVPVSPQQIDIFSRLYPMNARPIQSASGRMIKESN